MALLAKTKNTIEKIGKNIPIPFSETLAVPPDKFSVRYTNNPNKIKFNMIFNLPMTNCCCLFLCDNMLNKDNVVLKLKRHTYTISLIKKNVLLEASIHNGTIKGNTPVIIKQRIK